MILHLISSEGFYGAENMLLNLMAALRAKGCDSTLGVFLNAHRPHSEIAQRAREKGFEADIIPCGGKLDGKAIAAIRALAAARRATILHTHGYKSDLYALAAGKGKLRLVATCHNWTAATLSVRAYEAADRLALRLFDRTVAVSGEVARRLKAWGTPGRKIVTIANGIDTSAFSSLRPAGLTRDFTSRGFTVGFVGRMAEGKGIHHLLAAAREVLTINPAVQFRLAGDGVLMGEMQALARNLGIERSVTFLGAQADMPAVYAGLDLMVLPSLNEGMPMCLLEAMASGVPVIATPVGDIPRVVNNGVTGLLVQPGDVAGLTAAIERVIEDERLRNDLALNGRRLIEAEYSAERMAGRYAGLYADLASARGAELPAVPVPGR